MFFFYKYWKIFSNFVYIIKKYNFIEIKNIVKIKLFCSLYYYIYLFNIKFINILNNNIENRKFKKKYKNKNN